MEYISKETARRMVRLLRLVAEYIPGVGARCTFCGNWGDRLYRRVYRPPSGRIERRYYQCRECGHRYEAECQAEAGRKFTPEEASED